MTEDTFILLHLNKFDSIIMDLEQDYYVRVFNPLGSVESFVNFDPLRPVEPFLF